MASEDTDGFKIATGYVEIRLKDSTQADYDAIKARSQAQGPIEVQTRLVAPDTTQIEATREALSREPAVELRTALETPSDTQIREVETRLAAQPPVQVRSEIDPRDVESSYQRARDMVESAGEPVEVPVKASDPITDAWRAQINADIKAIAVEALQVPATPELAEYRAELQEQLAVLSSEIRQGIPAEVSDVDKYRRDVQDMVAQVDAEVKAKIQAEVDPASLEKMRAEIETALAGTKTTVSADTNSGGGDSIGHYGALYTAIGGAIAGGAGALEGGALAAIPAAFTAIGAAAEKSNPEVSGAFASMETAAKSALQNGFEPLAPAFVQIAAQGKSALTSLEPEFQQAAAATAPLLTTVSSGLIKATQDGVRGSVPILQQLQPVAQAISDDFGKVEQGIGGFFKNINVGDAAQGLSLLGTDIAELLPAVASLLNDIAPLGNAFLSVLGPALKDTATDLSVLRPVAEVLASVITTLAPGIAAVAPPLMLAAAGSKLLTGSWTDLSGAGNKLLSPFQNMDSSLTSLANKLGYTTDAQKAQSVADAELTASKAKLAAATADEAVAEAQQAVASDASAKNQLGLISALEAQQAAAKAAATAEEDLATATEASQFSMGPLGIALGVVGFALSGFIGSSSKASDSTGQLNQQLAQLATASPQTTQSLLGNNQQLVSMVAALNNAGTSVTEFDTAVQGSQQTQQSYIASLQQSQQALGAQTTSLDVATLATSSGGKMAGELAQTTTTTTQSVKDLAAAVQGNSEAFAKLSPQQQQQVTDYNAYTTVINQAQQAAAQYNAVQQVQTQVLQSQGITLSAASQAWNSYGNSVSGTVSAFNSATSGIKSMTDDLVSADSGFLTAQQNFRQLDQAVAQAQQSYTQASEGVASAQYSITQAAQSVASAQHSEQQAALAVVTAEQGVQTALQGVATAEQSLANAQHSELEAQQALTQARVQAAQELQNLQLQVQDQAASEDAARLQLLDATTAVQNAGLSNVTLASLGAPTASNEYAYKLLLQQQQAQNNLNDVLSQGVQLRTQQAQADALGVSGNASVVSAQDQLTQAQQQAQQAAIGLKNAQQGVVTASQGVTNAQYSEQQSHLAVQNAIYGEQQASQALQNAIVSQHNAAVALTQAKDADSRSTDINTDSGNKNFTTLENLFEQNFKTTGSIDSATSATEAEGVQMGFTKTQIDNVIKSVTSIPATTNFAIVGTPSLNLGALIQQAQAQGINPYSLGLPSAEVDQWVPHAAGPSVMMQHATGGLIQGPGTTTSDSILSWLSHNEYVQPADTVDYYGLPLMEALRTKAIPREALPHFATGGSAATDPTTLMGINYRLAGWDGFLQGTSNVLTNFGYTGMPSLPPPPQSIDFGLLAAAAIGSTPGVPQSVAANEAAVQAVFSQYGWGTGAEWAAAIKLIMRESGFRNTAQNPTSTAFGIFQFLNSTWASYGIPKTSDPTQQAIAGARYIQARYGDPLGAQAHETAYGWYDHGGYLPTGFSGVANLTGKPEMVLPPKLGDTLTALHGAVQNRPPVGAAAQVVHHHTHNYHITVRSNESAMAVAAQVSAATAWNLRAGRQ